MQKIETKEFQPQSLQDSEQTYNNEIESIFSEERFTKCESIDTFNQHIKDSDSNTLRVPKKPLSGSTSLQNSFYSRSNQMRIDESLDNELIFSKKVQRKDIVFKSCHFKESFSKYFTEVIFGFLKQPTNLTFSIALQRLKFYDQQNPFIDRNSKTDSDKHNSSFNSTKTSFTKTSFSNIKTVYSVNDNKSDLNEDMTVENLLRSMFYRNQYQFMIYTFDYAFCHLTFLASMMYFWSKLKITSFFNTKNNFFTRSFYSEQKKSYLDNLQCKKSKQQKRNIYKTLKLYITERSQSLNISQINILIVYFFLNYLKKQSSFEDLEKEIIEIQQNFITKLKMYRRMKKMEKEFNCVQNQAVLEWQLHKYEYENKLVESMDKTFLIFNFLHTHNFVSSSLQKYFQLHDFENSKKNYHLKRDNFCIWVMSIILRLCEKKNPQSISKSAFYIVTFMAILKKFKENNDFQGISLFVPILYNIKEQLPKVWSYAESRRKEISEKLREYSQLLNYKIYKKKDISLNFKAIINQDVIYEMCKKFTRYAHIDKKFQQQSLIDVEKHRTFYEDFFSHVVSQRKLMQVKYRQEIEAYKKQKQIGISFNMYLLDSYVCKRFRGASSKALWDKMIEKCKKTNDEMSTNIYTDFFDYFFIGSTLKYSQFDI